MASAAPAQDAGSGQGGPAASSPPASSPPASPPPVSGQAGDDGAAARIKYLHERLRITAEQEEAFERLGQAIADNARVLAPLLKERLRATTYGTAPETLRAYQALGEAQLDHLRSIVSAFEPLYASLSESQKKIADAVLREGAQSAMMGGSAPLVPPPFTSALAFPSAAVVALPYPVAAGGPGRPLATFPSAGGFRVFHGVPAHVRFGRFHRR